MVVVLVEVVVIFPAPPLPCADVVPFCGPDVPVVFVVPVEAGVVPVEVVPVVVVGTVPVLGAVVGAPAADVAPVVLFVEVDPVAGVPFIADVSTGAGIAVSADFLLLATAIQIMATTTIRAMIPIIHPVVELFLSMLPIPFILFSILVLGEKL
ncbi:MAG: hypothetical protein JWM20_143 [Patescibacteria group bacterium]|nr:hypothetical protein [Patescibacteria group bacterium]